jgi:hypothetical protein
MFPQFPPNTKTASEILNDLLILVANGISVVPIKHGEKRPDPSLLPEGEWTVYQGRFPTPDELVLWSQKATSFGSIAGKISGNMEIIDFDDYHKPGTFEMWKEILSPESKEILETLPLVKTQRGGFHLRYRTEEPPQGNLKLYRDLDPVTGKQETIIETRGEGGQALIPPSEGYELVNGLIYNVPVIPKEVREEFFEVAKSFGVGPDSVDMFSVAPAHVGEERPGDAYEKSLTWEELIGPYGWKKAFVRRDGVVCWRRPGKDRGISATSGFGEKDLLYVFSSNADPFDLEKSYSKFGAYALLEHGGDFKLASKTLSEKGFGKKKDEPLSIEKILERRAEVVKAEVLHAKAVADSQALNSLEKYTCGMSRFDDALGGGFSAGNLIVTAGRTGVGKTLVSQNWTMAFARNKISSLWFTYEVLPRALWEKFCAMGANGESQVYLPSWNENGDIEWVLSMIDQGIERYGVKFVVVDHLGFLRPPKIKGVQYANHSDAITHTVRTLKQFAVSREIIVALPVHVRKSRGSFLDLDDVKDSAGIVQEADAVFFVDRLSEQGTGLYQDKSSIRLQKNRETGISVQCIFDFVDTMLVYNESDTLAGDNENEVMKNAVAFAKKEDIVPEEKAEEVVVKEEPAKIPAKHIPVKGHPDIDYNYNPDVW